MPTECTAGAANDGGIVEDALAGGMNCSFRRSRYPRRYSRPHLQTSDERGYEVGGYCRERGVAVRLHVLRSANLGHIGV